MRALLVVLAMAVVSLDLGIGTASAQLVLPGATAPHAIGSVVSPTAGQKPRPHSPRLPSASAAPAETALAGKTLYLNGGKSQIGFTLRDKTVDVTRLLLEGTKISRPQDTCQVDVQSMPLILQSPGKVNGLNHFAVPLPACPMAFDVLDGAILMTASSQTCLFTEADCKVSPDGIWGPPPGEIGADQVKTIERERTRAESELRLAYKGLVSSTKDRAMIGTYARDQAGFSSRREELCRDYIGEARHGFCAARMAEARAAELQTAYLATSADKAGRKKR